MIQSKSLLILIATLFNIALLNTSLRAQINSGIKATVVDEKNVPLPFATVVLRTAADSGIYKSVLTSDVGQFELLPVKPGKYLLQVSMMGYETAGQVITMAGASLDLGNIRLNLSSKMLGTVIIAAKKPLIERRPDKIIVNLNEGITAGASAMEVMDRLPGVSVSPDDQISLNGRGIRIYIDGKATPLSAEALSGLLKGMSSSSIQKIELIAHPSAKYDAAGGGIINIVRKRSNKEGLNGNVYGGLGQGEYPKHNAGLNLNYQSGKFNLLINNDYLFNKYFVNNDLVSVFLNAGSKTVSQSRSRINSTRTNRNYTPTIGLDYHASDKTILSLSVMQGLQWFGKDATSTTTNLTSANTLVSTDQFLNLVNTDNRNFSANTHLAHKLDTSGRELTIDADYYRYSNRTQQDNANTIFDKNGGLISYQPSVFDLGRYFDVYSLKADFTMPLKGKAQIETGAKSSYVNSNNSNQWYDLSGPVPVLNEAQNDIFRYRENINALYVTYSNEHNRLLYQLGLRAEQTLGKGKQVKTGETFGKNYFQLFPSAYLTYKLDKTNELILSADRKVDRPTYENLNPLIRIINSTNYLQGNPSLRSATSYNLSATYGYQSALFTTLEYSIRYHDFTYFTLPFGSGITTTRPENNKYSQYYDLIIAYNKQVRPWWYTSSNMTLNRRSYQSTANDNSLSTSGRVALNLDSYNSWAVNKKFSLIALFRYRGKTQERNITTDPYLTLTTGLRQSLWNNKASVAINVTDIFHSYKSRYLQSSALVNQYWINHYETTAVRLNFTYSFGGKIRKTKTGNGAAEEKRRTDLKEN
jgi:hypothetical protein